MIINARNDFENHLGLTQRINDKVIEISSAIISYEEKNKFINGKSKLFILNPNYSGDVYNMFLETIDFDYDTETHRIEGFILYKDGSWSERYAYINGWNYHVKPDHDNRVKYFRTTTNIEQEIIFHSQVEAIDENEVNK